MAVGAYSERGEHTRRTYCGVAPPTDATLMYLSAPEHTFSIVSRLPVHTHTCFSLVIPNSNEFRPPSHAIATGICYKSVLYHNTKERVLPNVTKNTGAE